MTDLTREQLRELVRDTVRETVEETLTRLGVDPSDPVEMQRDFTHLRDWRKAVETARSTSMFTVLGILATGLMGALWIGIQEMLKGPTT